MSLSEFAYRRFETLVRPLDIPFEPLTTQSPFALVLYYTRMFRGVVVAIVLFSVATECINLAVIWGIATIVDGVSDKGAAAFLQQDWPLLAVLGVFFGALLPLFIFLANTLRSQVVSICMPVSMLWQGHKSVERQDLAFFHDLFAGQVATRISQVAGAVRQQVVVAFQSVSHFLVQFIGSLVLLAAPAWPLALPVFVWIVANVAIARWAVLEFSSRASRSTGARSRVIGAMTDLYSNIQMVKLFAAEDTEAGSLRTLMEDAVGTQQQEGRVYLTADTGVVLLNVAMVLATVAIGLWGLVAGFVSIGEFVGRPPSSSGCRAMPGPSCRSASSSSRPPAPSATPCRW